MKRQSNENICLLFSFLLAGAMLVSVSDAAAVDVATLSNTVLELSVQNQSLKSGLTEMTREKELLEARINACQDKMARDIADKIRVHQELEVCKEAMSRVDSDKLEQKKVMEKLRAENTRLAEQTRLLLEGMDKTQAMGDVIQKSSRIIRDMGDEKELIADENARLVRLNAALEIKAKQAIKKAEEIVSRSAIEVLRLMPRKPGSPDFVKDLKAKNLSLTDENVRLSRLNEELRRRRDDSAAMVKNNQRLTQEVLGLKKELDALKSEHARLRTDYTGLHRNLDLERASIYREAGAAYVKQEFYHEAIDAYLQSLKLDPQDVLTRYYIGILYSKVSEDERALPYLHEYLKMAPKAENRDEVLYIISLIENPSARGVR